MDASLSLSSSSMDQVDIRTHVLAHHRRMASSLDFDTRSLRKLLDGERTYELEYMWKMMIKSNLFCPRERGGKVFISPDFNQPMEQQREMTMKRIDYLREQGAFDGWLTRKGPEAELWGFTRAEAVGYFDHSLAIKLGVHFFLWYVSNDQLIY